MPRIEPDSYIVYPTGYDECTSDEKMRWCLSVKNGHKWGWSIRHHAGYADERDAMNRKGEWIYEQRGHAQNKSRRYTLEEALRIAEKYVDSARGAAGGMTFTEFADWYNGRKAAV